MTADHLRLIGLPYFARNEIYKETVLQHASKDYIFPHCFCMLTNVQKR